MAKNSLSIKRREGGGGRKCVQRTDGRTGEKGNIRRPKHIRETTKNKYNTKKKEEEEEETDVARVSEGSRVLSTLLDQCAAPQGVASGSNKSI